MNWCCGLPPHSFCTSNAHIIFMADPTSFSWQIVVVADEACAPELEPDRLAVLAYNEARFVNGWLKQQVGLGPRM